MATLELECPNCGELLELDAGFAGGVCRCSSCAMLMSVPAHASQAPPERLVRPERPPERPPDRPTTSLAPPSSKPATARASVGRAAAPNQPRKTADLPSQPAAPPPAPRRRSARRLTLGILGLALLVAAVLGAIALGLALRAENADAGPAKPAMDPMSDASTGGDLAKTLGSRYIPPTQGQWARWNRDADATRTGAGDGS